MTPRERWFLYFRMVLVAVAVKWMPDGFVIGMLIGLLGLETYNYMEGGNRPKPE